MDSCKSVCDSSATCQYMSFDSANNWCSTYRTCLTPTSKPHGNVRQTGGWTTYAKATVEFVNKGVGTYCDGHPGGFNEGVYSDQSACQAACSRNPSCVAYDWYAPKQWCVIAEMCTVKSGGSWTHVEVASRSSSANQLCTGTFVSNEHREWKDQTPLKISESEYVFGGYDGGWFKMAKVDSTGKVTETRHTNAVSEISKLTVAIWNAANKGGEYKVKSVSCRTQAEHIIVKGAAEEDDEEEEQEEDEEEEDKVIVSPLAAADSSGAPCK